MGADTEKCVHCGRCTASCLFLQKYGLDLAALARRPELAYSCFLCGKCAAVCPVGIDGAAVALELRRNRAGDGKALRHDAAYRLLLWEKSPYKFANYRQASGRSVLFPGCNFPSFFPKTMEKLAAVMGSHGVGVVYDCCEKPVCELGLTEDAGEHVGRMEEKLRARGVEELVMVCPNCWRFLAGRIGTPMVTVYEKLRQLGVGGMVKRDTFPLYYPCPDRTEKRFFADILPFLEGEVTDAFDRVQCCGLGGCASAREPALSRQMTAQAVEAAGAGELYTYCASCVGNFRRAGMARAYHLLPLILGVDEAAPLGVRSLLNRARRAL